MDSPAQLQGVLEESNQELGEFASSWAIAAGTLKRQEKRLERLYRSALRGTQGRNAEERQATAYAAVEQVEPGLAEKIEVLVGEVEEFRIRFKVIDRRSENARSLLASHRESAKIEEFVPRRANA